MNHGARILRIFSSIALGALMMLIPFAANAEDFDKDSQRLYREHCKHCHEEGSANGEYTPLTLIQDQWVRFFKRKYERKHAKVTDQKFEGKPVTEVISPEVLELIKTFAIDHAADSEQPMNCG